MDKVQLRGYENTLALPLSDSAKLPVSQSLEPFKLRRDLLNEVIHHAEETMAAMQTLIDAGYPTVPDSLVLRNLLKAENGQLLTGGDA